MASTPIAFVSTGFVGGASVGTIDVRGDGPMIQSTQPVLNTGAGTSNAGEPSFSFLGDLGKIGIGILQGFADETFGQTLPTDFSGAPCPDGRIRVGQLCLDPSAAFPGGVPLAIPAGGTVLNGGGSPAVVGAFGVPARQPVVVAQPTRRCPRGMVLGQDLLCYMKGTIPMKFRRWKPGPKPPMSAADAKALRRIGALQSKVKRLAKSANLTCKRK